MAVIVLGLLLCLLCSGDKIYKAEFDNFIAQYDRKYNNVKEYEERLQIFSSNMEIAQRLNAADAHAQ